MSSPVEILQLRAPHQCTTNRNCARHTSPGRSIHLEKTRHKKAKAPEYGALRLISSFFVTNH